MILGCLFLRVSNPHRGYRVMVCLTLPSRLFRYTSLCSVASSHPHYFGKEKKKIKGKKTPKDKHQNAGRQAEWLSAQLLWLIPPAKKSHSCWFQGLCFREGGFLISVLKAYGKVQSSTCILHSPQLQPQYIPVTQEVFWSYNRSCFN